MTSRALLPPTRRGRHPGRGGGGRDDGGAW